MLRSDGRVVLRSPAFDPLVHPDDVVAAVEPIVEVLNTAAHALLHIVFDIEIDAVRVFGSPSRFVYREAIDGLESSDYAVMVDTDAADQPRELRPDTAAQDAAAAASLALANPEVARCLRLLAQHVTWAGCATSSTS